MVNPNDPSGTKQIRDQQALDEPKSDATNDETESDLSSAPELDPVPSPDGAFDESKETGPF